MLHARCKTRAWYGTRLRVCRVSIHTRVTRDATCRIDYKRGGRVGEGIFRTSPYGRLNTYAWSTRAQHLYTLSGLPQDDLEPDFSHVNTLNIPA